MSKITNFNTEPMAQLTNCDALDLKYDIIPFISPSCPSPRMCQVWTVEKLLQYLGSMCLFLL